MNPRRLLSPCPLLCMILREFYDHGTNARGRRLFYYPATGKIPRPMERTQSKQNERIHVILKSRYPCPMGPRRLLARIPRTFRESRVTSALVHLRAVRRFTFCWVQLNDRAIFGYPRGARLSKISYTHVSI